MDVGKREDRILDEMARLYRTRRSTIRVCVAYKAALPELTEHMDWILAALEVTEGELQRA